MPPGPCPADVPGRNVAGFGVGAYKPVKGGTGSGDVYNRYTVTVRQGLANAGYRVTTSDAFRHFATFVTVERERVGRHG